MELNLEVCKTIAVQYGLPLQFVVKEFFVFDVLAQITTLTANSKKLVFKGGTALNKVYLGKAQRFSEDLDFDSGSERLSQTREESKKIAEKLSGYDAKEFRRVGDSIQFYCSFESPLGGKDHVRVDIAAKKIITAKPLQVKTAFSTCAQRSVTGFSVYSIEDLTARKLHALRTRTEGKDFYDVHNALPLCGSLEGALEKMLESERIKETPKEFLAKTAERVKKADAKKLRNLTNPFIPAPYRPRDWLELKNDLAAKLEAMG